MAGELKLQALEFYIHSDVWDEGGSLTSAHMRFFVDESGMARRIDYDAPEPVREMIVSLGAKWARVFLDEAVSTLRVAQWPDLLVDAGETVVSFPGTKPLHEDKCGDFAEYSLYQNRSMAKGEPLWSLRLTAEDGAEHAVVFYHRMHDEPQALFWALMELFEPKDEWLGEDE